MPEEIKIKNHRNEINKTRFTEVDAENNMHRNIWIDGYDYMHRQDKHIIQ